MKLSLGLTAVLAGCATAAQQAAEVYMFRHSESSSSSTPTISPSLARLIMLQRLASPGKGPSTSQIPEDIELEDALDALNTFGLVEGFSMGQESAPSPKQLVIMIDGISDRQMEDMSGLLESKPAFTIENPPSSTAHKKLVENDFYNAGVTNEHKCSVQEVMNPVAEECWSGMSTVAKYSLNKDGAVVGDLVKRVSNLAALASSGEMETTVVFLPESGKANKWSSGSQELRRRQSPVEQPISASEHPTDSDAPVSEPSDSPDAVFYPTKAVASCFGSEDSCQTATGNCSGHGSCVNKYSKGGKEACFTCRCLSTASDSGSVTHWAGPTCAKKDVSVGFWLFAGFTLVMVGILSLSLNMLFNVGQEKLPGVIGAGVSRSK